MARLVTAGAETIVTADLTTNAGISFEVINATSGTVTVDTATVHSPGLRSYKCDSAVGNAAAYVAFQVSGSLAVTYYARAWINGTVNPGTATYILEFFNSSTALMGARLNTTGTVTGLGSSNSPVITDGVWHCVEASLQMNSGASDDIYEIRVDGLSIESSSTANLGTLAPTLLRVGWTSAPGASRVIYFDDVAVNNTAAGGTQTSFAGLGQEVLLLPTADSAVGTGWTLGTGTAISGNSGSTAVKNIAPLGVADLAAGSDTKQIRNASANASVSYDATMTTYIAAGVPANGTINVIDPLVWTAAPVTTSSKQGTVGVVSNPTIANIALGAGGTAGAFWSGATGGTYPTGWKLSHGTLTYAPSVTLSTAPVMRITQVTSSTRIAVVCFLGIYVDYTPVYPRAVNVSQAVMRASTY